MVGKYVNKWPWCSKFTFECYEKYWLCLKDSKSKISWRTILQALELDCLPSKFNLGNPPSGGSVGV